MAKQILITGANSYIGTAFQNWLQQYHDHYLVDTVDMIDGTWREKSFRGYDSVFHVAGIAHVTLDPKLEGLYYQVNRDLAIETATKAKEDGVRQVIFMSSIIVYGDSSYINQKRIIDKDTVPVSTNFYGDSKLQAEKGILKLQDETFNVVILRPPMIYGKASKGNYPKLAQIARKLPLFPDVNNQRSMLHIDNLCEFVRLMIDNEERGIFFPQNAEYVKTSEMVRLIAETQGKKLYLTKVFNPLLRLMGVRVGTVNKAFGNLVYEESLSEYKDNYRVWDLPQSILATESLFNVEQTNIKMRVKGPSKICLISSSGGHYEQLKMLTPLSERYNIFWVTENTNYASKADYYLFQTGMNDKLFPLKMMANFFKSIKIWYKERPDYIITTGTMIVLPMVFMAKIFRKKMIYIETFARVYDGTRAGRLIYKYADLFIIQWEQLQKIYPKGVYGGSIY